MKNTDLSALPKNIERQLSELELKHKLHQKLMEWQREWKAIRRERHRTGWRKFKPIPSILV